MMIRKSAVLAGVIALLALGGKAGAQSTNITLKPLFIDTEGRFGAATGFGQRPGMFMEFYFEEGLADRVENLGSYDNPSGHPAGTIYVYRYHSNEMGGTALGYNHVGNGAFFHPTILVPSSQVPEVAWRFDNPIETSGVVIESVPYIADRGDAPSIALSQDFSGQVLADYSCSMGVIYLSGNALFPGSGYYQFAQGGVSFGMAGFWGPFTRSPSSREIQFSNISAAGPIQISFGGDGYTTTTVTLSAQTKHGYEYKNLMAATTGKSASQYLQDIGFEPSPPPLWVKKMALEEKLTGKTQWLYPPLDRHADANGDGVYDAADLAAAIAAGSEARSR
ncbi:hypothetical protein BH09SUM1_BH09SUM1_23130 [soil metagenome]